MRRTGWVKSGCELYLLYTSSYVHRTSFSFGYNLSLEYFSHAQILRCIINAVQALRFSQKEIRDSWWLCANLAQSIVSALLCNNTLCIISRYLLSLTDEFALIRILLDLIPISTRSLVIVYMNPEPLHIFHVCDALLLSLGWLIDLPISPDLDLRCGSRSVLEPILRNMRWLQWYICLWGRRNELGFANHCAGDEGGVVTVWGRKRLPNVKLHPLNFHLQVSLNLGLAF